MSEPSDLQSRFTRVFSTNMWQDPESLSGPGSRLQSREVTETLDALTFVCERFEISSIIDVPCGDLNWMPTFLKRFPQISYQGYDIVQPLIERNRQMHPDIRCDVLDVTTQVPARADLALCKDLFIHLNEDDIRETLRNLQKSGCTYALLSNNFDMPNEELREAQFGDSVCRYVDLTTAPYGLPKPIWRTDYLGLWALSSVGL